jgi:carbon monoxide dehydrogenase subunit G
MKLEHSFSIPVGIDQAWNALLDVERIAPCMPGAAVSSAEGDEYTGSVKVRLGPMTLTYKGKARIVEKDDAQHRAVIDAQGRDARGNGTAAATVSATLTSEGSATRVEVVTDLNVTGKPAQFGRGIMIEVGNKLIGQFADCLAAELASGNAAAVGVAGSGGSDLAGSDGTEPAGGSAGTATGSDGTGAAPGSAGTGTGSDGTDAAAGSPMPAAGSATAPLAATAPLPPTQPQPDGREPTSSFATAGAEPINLMSSAGPAVVKRLLPVLVAVAAVVIAVIRWRRR